MTEIVVVYIKRRKEATDYPVCHAVRSTRPFLHVAAPSSAQTYQLLSPAERMRA